MATTKHDYRPNKHTGNIQCPRCKKIIRGFSNGEQRACRHCHVVLRRTRGWQDIIFAVDNEFVDDIHTRLKRDCADGKL